MTFKDLKKKVRLEVTQQQSRLFERLQNKPFWIWNIGEHKQEDIKTNGDCCFNHVVGLPQKDGIDKPLYDYQKILFEFLVSQNNNKHLWIKKATGLGISEFMLRFMAWLCLKDNLLSGSRMSIVTGPRIDLAIALIDRMKKLFASSNNIAAFDTKETVIELNNVKIEAFPSHHLDAMRGLPDVSFILLDEADFFPPGQQQDARDVSERHIAKSNPYIVMVSTPNAPEGLFERIEKESEDTCLYERIFLDYTYGVGKQKAGETKMVGPRT
ncbi:MAG TPA: DEAD/DEAH box helicase family protein [Nitrososphaeraceae archaeon]|nr:DEAD/DEAH box helicase family protein [Nitrososphaeraceae archaeon]